LGIHTKHPAPIKILVARKGELHNKIHWDHYLIPHQFVGITKSTKVVDHERHIQVDKEKKMGEGRP